MLYFKACFRKTSKGQQPIRYLVSPESLIPLATSSDRYHQLRLINYPVDTDYPESAEVLKSLTHWAKGKPTSKPEHTLLYRLLHAMLVGVEENSEVLLMKFQQHRYRESQPSLSLSKSQQQLFYFRVWGKKSGPGCYCCGSH
jgi:hypothetical protein